MLDADFAALLERDVTLAGEDRVAIADALPILARELLDRPTLARDDAVRTLEALLAAIDAAVERQINAILHHAEFRALEATWRGLVFLLRATESGEQLKIRVLDLSKRELARSLRKFRGIVWDQSPLFHRVYEEEYGRLGGEPFGLLVGDYAFDHHPEDVALLAALAQIAAAAHAPFIAAAAPSLLQMESWAELANPRDPTRIFTTPEYTAWRGLRESEDARYLGLCLPRFLLRLPYGHRTDPVDAFAFEEASEGPDASRYLWGNAAFAMASNITRAFAAYGWCAQIRGIDTGGAVEDLPMLSFATADGGTDRRCPTEIALSESREAALADAGLMALVYRKSSDVAAFISAQSLQKPAAYDDADATANALMSARLPYLFASCRFAHYLKCLVRDRIGAMTSRAELQMELNGWISRYIDSSGERAPRDRQASCPLASGTIIVQEKPDQPGFYDAKFFLRPYYQLEGLTMAIRLVSQLPAPA